MAEIEQWTQTRPARACEDILMRAGVPCSRYLTLSEAIADLQVVARGTMAYAQDGAGRFLVPDPPFQFTDGSVAIDGRVPALGEDTRRVLETKLKMTPADIDALAERTVISG